MAFNDGEGRPKLTLAVPVLSVQTLHEMAKAFVELADVAGARRVMRDAADVLALRPRLGRIVSEHAALKNRLAELPAGSVGPSSLTTAELRLLPLLVTHLTYPEIGERLYVSRHTVKTQALSIYRKLGVSSRTDAVERARAVGLISL
jgi:LuxR family maltose regulon positive regulatory protein